ncbi:MAG: hypothetical protein Q7S27_03405 [Nanoarchaeota archaeon]|nr:hypothetical protein [Nanoarchaeota archaeon]
MEWKEFFKPTLGKIIFFVILIILTILVPKTARICSMGPSGVSCGQTNAHGIGYPMFFGTQFTGDSGGYGLYPLNLLINIVVYCLLSCGIVFLYKKLRK